MARISEQVDQIITEEDKEWGIPEEKKTYEYLIPDSWCRKCLITWENEPKRWWMYANDFWIYVIWSEAVNIRDNWIHTGFVDLWIAIGDAMLDSTININIAPEHADAILAAIKVGILHATSRTKIQQ